MPFGRAGAFRRTSSFTDELRNTERPSCCDSFWAFYLDDYIDDETFATFSVFAGRDFGDDSEESSTDMLDELEKKGKGQFMTNLPKEPSLADPNEYKAKQSTHDIISKIQRLEKKVRSRSKSRSKRHVIPDDVSLQSQLVTGPEQSYAEGTTSAPRVTRRPIPTDAERELKTSLRQARTGSMRSTRSISRRGSMGLSIATSRSGLDPVGSTDGTTSGHIRRSMIQDREPIHYEDRSSLRSTRTFEPPRPEEPREPEAMEYGTSSRPLVIADDGDDFAPSERSRAFDEREMPITPTERTMSRSRSRRQAKSPEDEAMLQAVDTDKKISQKRKEERRAALQRIRAIKDRLNAVQ